MEVVPVSECMTKEVHSIAPELAIDVALELMGANSVRRLPVLSASGRLVGIITREEARVAVETARCENPDQPRMPRVREVMTDFVYTVGPDDPIHVAAEMMVSHSVGALPVVADGKVVGIVTESDLFKFLAGHLANHDVD